MEYQFDDFCFNSNSLPLFFGKEQMCETVDVEALCKEYKKQIRKNNISHEQVLSKGMTAGELAQWMLRQEEKKQNPNKYISNQ